MNNRTRLRAGAHIENTVAEHRRVNADAIRLNVDPPMCIEYVGDEAFAVIDRPRMQAYVSATYAELELMRAKTEIGGWLDVEYARQVNAGERPVEG